MAIADNPNQRGIRMWPSPETATLAYDIANFALVASLVVGVLATVVVVWMGNRKEEYLRRDLAAAASDAAQANARAAEASLELERLRRGVESRRLTPEQATKLTNALNAVRAHIPAVTFLTLGDIEADKFANGLMRAFLDAGINVTQNRAGVRIPAPVGVQIVDTPDTLLGKVFATVGIPTAKPIMGGSVPSVIVGLKPPTI